jgi:hypothetical protein
MGNRRAPNDFRGKHPQNKSDLTSTRSSGRQHE